ncbi:MAG: T9SS type A sorting domain-containing protein [Sphingobacteriaceae bacterium]|nr:T9SS type A sorting domain-containing protein [Sphingobacteriaceae bacterium]
MKKILLSLFIICIANSKFYSQATCASAVVINQVSLPYASGVLTTCGTGNDYGVGSGAGCNTSYGAGEDYVFRLNITSAPASYNFTMGGAGTWKICQVFNGCPAPAANPTNCIGNITTGGGNTASGNINFPTVGTYYIVIDTWPTPACGTFTLGINLPPTCPGALGSYTSIAAFPYSNVNTTCGKVNNLTGSNASPVCGSASYYNEEDAIYTFTPATTGSITINLTTAGSWSALMLYNGCPFSGGACVANNQSSSGSKSMCALVTAGTPYYLIIDSWTGGTCLGAYTLGIVPSATVPPCNMAYAVTSIPYSFDVFAGTTTATTDDVLYTNIINFGFPFCYDGASYTDGYIASNASFVFDALVCAPNVYFNQVAAVGIGTGYSITQPAPSLVSGTSSTPQNAILGPWHDTNPSLGGVIRYATIGTTPNRRFVVSWENVPMFSCGTASPAIYHTGQIKLFETSNNIEIHIGNKGVCPGWNNGQAILGLENYNGTIYVPPVNATMHNATAAGPYNQWTMTNTAYRFTTACGSGGTCVVLPIGFKAFYCQRIDQVNQINWETDIEENVKHFKVERSTDAQNFTEIATVSPNNSPSKYTYEDKTAMPGMINYYRIVAYEKSGTRTATFMYPLGAVEGEVAISNIFPNPAHDDVKIGIDSKIFTVANVVVYDLCGKVVKSYSEKINTGLSHITLNIEDLKAGIYLLEVNFFISH